jgi:hypothetical protein
MLAIVRYLVVRGPVNRIVPLSRNAAKERKIGGWTFTKAKNKRGKRWRQ